MVPKIDLDFLDEREATARAASHAAKTRAERSRYMGIAYQWTAIRLAEETWVEAIAAKSLAN
jgi:hypothetical protein